MARIAVVDDHKLIRSGLCKLLRDFGHKVLFEADNGYHLQEQWDPNDVPDIVLLDINMPLMDGPATAGWLKKNYPAVKILVLSMYDDETSIIRMIKAGAKGYILKDCEPGELQAAIAALTVRGFYTSELVSTALVQAVSEEDAKSNDAFLNSIGEKERQFLLLACTEMTYKEIAQKMYVSPRTLEDYRDELYRKLGIRSRVGLVLFAVKHGLIKM